MKKIIFGLGSNLGDRRNFLHLAITALTEELHLKNIKKSKIIENKALLLPGSPENWDKDFCNLVISADFDCPDFLSTEEVKKILAIIKNIENKLGRQNRGKWSPREIDIDILAIDEMSINLGKILQIPHSQILHRKFCVDGFKEIEPELFEAVKSILERHQK